MLCTCSESGDQWCKQCVAAVSLFGLLTELSTFFNDSYKRMKVWEEHLQTKPGNKKRLRLERIGQSRCSSRGRALRKIFGSYMHRSVIRILFRLSDHPSASDWNTRFQRNTWFQTFLLKQTASYFVTHGSSVHAVFLDASKAFDRVLHMKLFEKLIQRKVPMCSVRLLKH